MEILVVALLCGAVMYSLLAIWAARRYLAVPPPEFRAAEPISVLKPLAGLDAGLETHLRTFFEQDYPAFEILFAVRSADDSAVPVVEKLQREYPAVESRLIVTGRSPYPNAKVYSLDRMLREAAHELIVMSDSDTSVSRDLLKTLAGEFRNPKLGVATCPYRAFGRDGIGSRLEAAGLNTDFLSGVLVARMMEGMRFALGPTVAARRAALDEIGGFGRLKDYLAEDFMLGRLVSDAGFDVILSSCLIDHHIGGGNWRKSAAHRLRWVRSTRRSRPLGYLGQLFTMTLPIAAVLVAIDQHMWPAAATALAIRAAAAWAVSTRVARAPLNWALLPVEDILAFAFWVAGFFGDTIEWRGRRYIVYTDGRFEALETNPPGEPVAIQGEP